ncbi:hypothetical protein AB833_10870 [Chromatiales bacterium (ex Bugula neritina AB1)]|nr:hypothetical protein AB833_10870 [Chromatiales bacterium (ex Bugula neritina AB1)]
MNRKFYWRFIILLCTLICGTATAFSIFENPEPEEFLDPETAFQTSVIVNENNELRAQIVVADGYYIYKDKTVLHSDDAFIGPAKLPAGIKKTDEFFGDVETYRGIVEFTAPVTGKSNSSEAIVSLESQGCADAGICYPPFKRQYVVEIPAQAAATQLIQTDSASPASSLLSVPGNNSLLEGMASLAGDTGTGLDNDSEVLDPELAFTVFANPTQNNEARINWNIAEGHYLYDHRFHVQVISPDDLAIADLQISEGKEKVDEFFGNVVVHRNNAEILAPFTSDAGAREVTLKVSYQGCADIGICFPPQSKELKILMVPAVATAASDSTPANNVTGTGNTSTISESSSSKADAPVMVAEQDRLAASLGSGKNLTTIFTFFGFGLLLTFTPCVLPMIPILSSIIVGSGEKVGTARAFTLSLVYVLAMAVTYTIAGVIIGLTGENIQATLQHPYVLISFAILFVILSGSMFGLFEIQMPAFVQNRLTNVSNKQKSGSFTGVATMGFLSALIVGPCVTAPLVGALIYIGQTGDAVLGGAALFALSMGMGVPLLIIGTSFGKYLPTAGAWMNVTKAIFGVMLLGVAIWMLDRVLPAWAIMILYALLLIVVGMFMGAFETFQENVAGWRRVSKGFGYVAVVYGTLLIIGVATGKGSLLRPLDGLSTANSASQTSAEHVVFTPVKGIDAFEAALADAQSQNKPVILDFYADWCISCKEMEAFTFTDPKVARLMNKAVLLQADVTKNDEDDKAMLKKFGMFGPPAIIFYDRQGQERDGSRVVGFVPADRFSKHLEQVL